MGLLDSLWDVVEITAIGKTANKSIGSIANPTRKITVNFPIDIVKQAIKNFPAQSKQLVKKTYRLQEMQETINYYMLEAMEFLSFGVYVDINLNDISETKTEITVEVRRKIGSFDESHEISAAGAHINNVLTGISKLFGNQPIIKPAPIPVPVTNSTQEVKIEKEVIKSTPIPELPKVIIEPTQEVKIEKVVKQSKKEKKNVVIEKPKEEPRIIVKQSKELAIEVVENSMNEEIIITSFGELYRIAAEISNGSTKYQLKKQ